MSVDEQLLQTARAWAAVDPDEQTAAELSARIEAAASGDAAAIAELTDAFDGTLQFGTAGLRGRLGPGSNRMNRVVVARAAAGLAQYLRDHDGKAIVIGYDARYQSDVFAHDTAAIMAAAGIAAKVLPRALPTPVLAFAIRHLGCDAGVMVTASHNPPNDNGYKVYLGDGSQIVPPADAAISACIAAVGPVDEIPRSEDYTVLGDDLLADYEARAVSLLAPGPRDAQAVYTAMHGVGGAVFMEVTAAAGFPAPRKVAEQFDPDPTFHTVPFPNPEEPGAMDLALAEAARAPADLLIANDPDADRCAVGIPVDGSWRMLSGDETGALLAWWVVQRARARGTATTGVMAQSIVSGSLLRAIAESAGFEYANTLTGFKWISRVPGLVFGYEEALGYCVDPPAVADKDGISASLFMLEMAAHLKAEGRTFPDVLDELAREHGVYLTSQVTVRVAEIERIAEAMTRLRAEPPRELGGRVVTSMEDLREGVDGLPPTDGLRLTMDGARVVIRPSGTEPKLKSYLQVVEPVEDDLAAARTAARAGMESLRASVAEAVGL
jgi:phosphomannomutase